MRVIGLAGTLASGKDTVGHLLAEKYGFLHVSTSDMLRAEKKRVFGDSPEALLRRNDPYAINLRSTKGPGILVELAYEEYRNHEHEFPGGLIASGIRSIGEAEKIKELGGVIIFVDADPKVRYKRAIARSRDKIDNEITYDDFLAMEQSESVGSRQDKSLPNLLAMKDMADLVLTNDGNDIEAFKKAVAAALDLS